MQARFLRLIASGALLAAIAACGSGGGPSPTPAAAPVSTPAVFLIRTPAVNPQACMDALMTGTIVRHPASGLGLVNQGQPPTPVEWPFGYRAFEVGGRVSLLDETGKVVAHEGDEIMVGGGFGNQFWHACGAVTVTKPAI